MEETRITSVIWGSVLMSLLRAFLARFLSLMTVFRAAFSAADAREFIPWGMLLRLWCSESSGGWRVEDGRWRVEGGRSRQDQTRDTRLGGSASHVSLSAKPSQ